MIRPESKVGPEKECLHSGNVMQLEMSFPFTTQTMGEQT